MRVDFFIEGRPVPKARPRVTRYGTYTPKATRQWERFVCMTYLNKFKMFHFGGDVPLSVWLTFVCPGKGKAASIRGDVENYAKSILDALNGYAWKDDVQIVSLAVTKQRVTKQGKVGVFVSIEPAQIPA